MPLYIKDPAVDSLVDQYLAATGLKNKTEALRRVLTDQLKMLADRETLTERVTKIQQRAADTGFGPRRNPPDDDKEFMDSLWGEN